jgi:hypothetical protein
LFLLQLRKYCSKARHGLRVSGSRRSRAYDLADRGQVQAYDAILEKDDPVESEQARRHGS